MMRAGPAPVYDGKTLIGEITRRTRLLVQYDEMVSDWIAVWFGERHGSSSLGKEFETFEDALEFITTHEFNASTQRVKAAAE